MKKLLLCLLAMTFATPALARDVSGWEVSATTDRASCVMYAEFEGDTTVALVFPASASEGNYFLFTNPRWTSIVKDAEYDLRIEIDSLGYWDMNAKGAVVNGEHGFSFGFDRITNTDGDSFLAEFAIGRSIDIRTKAGAKVARLNLAGTNAAIMEGIRCRNRLQDSVTYDPFKDGPSKPAPKTKSVPDDTY